MGPLGGSRTLTLLLSLLALCLAIAAARLVTKRKTAPLATAALPDQEVRPDVPDGLDNKKVSPEADRAMIVERANQGQVMYTVFKAKEEIDALARHTMELAEHALASDQKMNSQLESFKHEILARIDAKFAELEKAIIGEAQPSESSAVSDLGAKIALLKPQAPVAAHGQEGEGDHGGHHDQGAGEHHG